MSARLVAVVGPSGVGKDSLLAYAQSTLMGNPAFRFARRYITRPASAGGEDHHAISQADFEARLAAGRFALHWESHGLRYGIGCEIDTWLSAGHVVVFNGSREYLPEVHKRYPDLRVISITASPEVLAQRLAKRRRESAVEIAARIARQPPLPKGLSVKHISNDGSLETAGASFVNALRDISASPMPTHNQRVGFIGLGRMGFPMAHNLLKAGYPVVAFNRSRAAVDRLVALGATAMQSPAATAQAADVLVSCVMTPADIEQVYLGSDGVLAGARPGLSCIDTSTTHPAISRKVAAALAAQGVAYLDAPISGGPRGAETGTLSIMVGGTAEALEQVRPILQVFGRNIFHMGPVGAGSAAKLCNQILTGSAHVLVAEAMVMGARLGLDSRQLFEVLQLSSGQCRALDRSVPEAILPRNFKAAFTVDGIIKDLDCALQTAGENGVRLLLPALARQVYQEASSLGHGGEHLAAVVRVMEHIAGVEVGGDSR